MTIARNLAELANNVDSNGVLGVAAGGTGATSNAAAPFAQKGANSDITSLTGLTTPLSVAQGGTGANSAAAARTALELGTAATTNSTAYATSAQGANADTAFGWGNHASANYLTSGAIGSTVQAYSANLAGWSAITTASKQEALVSGTNIKSINNTSLLGSGNVSVGTVTSVGGTGTVNGLTLTGTVTSSGNLTLGGTLSNVSLTSQVTGTLPIANGGTGQATRQAAMDALAGSVTSGHYLRGDGSDVVMSAIQASDVPTLNQNTTGTASNVTGTVAIANGGTGQTSKANAFNALSPITSTGDLIVGNGTNSATRLGIGTNGQVLQSNGTTAVWATPSGSSPTNYGDIGTYVVAASNSMTPNNTVYAQGTTYAGSSLVFSSSTFNGIILGGDYYDNSNPIVVSTGQTESAGLSGTWRLMTKLRRSAIAGTFPIGIFLRIA